MGTKIAAFCLNERAFRLTTHDGKAYRKPEQKEESIYRAQRKQRKKHGNRGSRGHAINEEGLADAGQCQTSVHADA